MNHVTDSQDFYGIEEKTKAILRRRHESKTKY